MSDVLRIFVSYTYEDTAFARSLVTALRGVGADVWYDEHTVGSGELGSVIARELQARPIFVLILSPAALASHWVEDACRQACSLLPHDPTRTLLSVLAAPITNGHAVWPALADFQRVEAPGLQPYLPAEAIWRTLLALTPLRNRPPVRAPQPTVSATDLVARGKALLDQERYADALPLFEVATQLDPESFDAWFNLGYTLAQTNGPAMKRLAAYEHAIVLSPTHAAAWTNAGAVLTDLQCYEEALAAFEQAITLSPTLARAWTGKGNALAGLQCYEDALAAFEQATTLDPAFALAWTNAALMLRRLGRLAEATAAAARAESA